MAQIKDAGRQPREVGKKDDSMARKVTRFSRIAAQGRAMPNVSIKAFVRAMKAADLKDGFHGRPITTRLALMADNSPAETVSDFYTTT